MKTAISIDDTLLQEVDKVAERLGMSRSRLFAVAVGDYLKRQRRERLVQQLNEAYKDGLLPSEKRILQGMKAKVRRTLEPW